MKNKFYLPVLIGALTLLCSCNNTFENEKLNRKELSVDASTAIAIKKDTLLRITPLLETSEMKFLKEIAEKMKKPQTRSASFSPSDIDPYLNDNMWAIKGLPINIKVRNKNSYFSSNGLGKEITLEPKNNRSRRQNFFLKLFAPSVGIPYMIYSELTQTPLGVGHYDSNPNTNVLFARTNDNHDHTAIWDLIPSIDYKGYFAIQNEAYLGQSDPNNIWSVFHYVLESKGGHKLGYGQYSKKAEQEFLIIPNKEFTLDYIEFHKETAKVNRQAPLKVINYGKNELPERMPITIEAIHYANDKSYFSEKSALKIPINNINSLFYRPGVVAMRLFLPSPVNPKDAPNTDLKRDMKYSPTQQNISHSLSFKIDIMAPATSVAEVTSYLENYSVSVDYTAHMSYNVSNEAEPRKVKIKGIWYGTIYTTKRDSRYPKDITKFWDLEEGEEILRARAATLSKTILK